jgi:CubicO group peptidase (beta-lactamase class C family)
LFVRLLKWIARAFALLLAVVVTAIAALYLSEPTYYTRALKRLVIDPVRDVDAYSPLERVAGRPGAALPRSSPAARTISTEAWAEAVAYAREQDTLALVVWHRDAIQYEYYLEGFDPGARTDPASMAKSVTALVLGLAVADGHIGSVDDPVAKYVPEWRNDSRRTITIRHLLTMTSGLAQEPFTPGPFSQGTRLNAGTRIEELVLSVPLTRPPGEGFSYFNFNSQLLGVVIERATGRRFADYLAERLWSRLGTSDAFVYLDREQGMARTYCCLQATAEDWLRVGQLYLGKGRIGDEQLIPESWMQMVVDPSPANPNYGFQVWLGTRHEPRRSYGPLVSVAAPQSSPFAANDVIFLDGSGGQRVYIVPSHDLVIVRTGGGGIDFRRGEFRWDDARVPNALLAGIRPEHRRRD